eukprot:11398065-Karenia_brevis.AAC.1
MQVAYDIVCARFKCYKGATRIQHTCRAGADCSVGSYYSATREDDSFEDVHCAEKSNHNDAPSAGSNQS